MDNQANATPRSLSFEELRLLRELDAVRHERNKTVEALLEACSSAQNNLMNINQNLDNQNNGRLMASISLLSQAIAKAEGR